MGDIDRSYEAFKFVVPVGRNGGGGGGWEELSLNVLMLSMLLGNNGRSAVQCSANKVFSGVEEVCDKFCRSSTVSAMLTSANEECFGWIGCCWFDAPKN
jgi:hypothetical protein